MHRSTSGTLLDQIGQYSSYSGMPRKYSLYEAKSKLSELVRQVREGGRPITITVHGRPVAELRPLEPEPSTKTTDERHAELERAGLV
ncbi:MAG: type II toxin-antitoxin system Phd/YefM family antitoxin, partial [Gemmatimonadales bacterium]